MATTSQVFTAAFPGYSGLAGQVTLVLADTTGAALASLAYGPITESSVAPGTYVCTVSNITYGQLGRAQWAIPGAGVGIETVFFVQATLTDSNGHVTAATVLDMSTSMASSLTAAGITPPRMTFLEASLANWTRNGNVITQATLDGVPQYVVTFDDIDSPTTATVTPHTRHGRGGHHRDGDDDGEYGR